MGVAVVSAMPMPLSVVPRADTKSALGCKSRRRSHKCCQYVARICLLSPAVSQREADH